ncbi:MAG TPA: hypothetical protein VKH64_09065, partial [Candidatus Binatia bacterium]|nr:hypothetical protein [Candidatus Binatia bacterium]
IEPETAKLYDESNRRCADWVSSTNQKLAGASLPARVVNLATVWTVLFKEPGRYNWLLQYYLRAEGMTLSWVGTGRCLSSMDFTGDDYRALETMLVDAASKMKNDGWWLAADEYPGREKTMRNRLVRELLGSLLQAPKPVKAFYAEIMQRKKDDHHASHSNAVNQFLHIVSSGVFLYCYGLIFADFTIAMCLAPCALLVRQFGHAVLEPPCHEKEQLLLGYDTRTKTIILLGYVFIPVANLFFAGTWSLKFLAAKYPELAIEWFVWTILVVGGRVLYLMWLHDFRTSMIWFVKLATDPLTDITAYLPRYLKPLKVLVPFELRKSAAK